MAFPDGGWPYGDDDDLDVNLCSSEKVHVNWDILNFLLECSKSERKKIKSRNFAFGGAMWNLFASFDRQNGHSLFGINIRGRGLTPSDSVLHCYCDIKFESAEETKSIIFKFLCESAESHCAAEEFLSDSELDMFLRHGRQIECDISIKRRCKRNDSSRSFITSPFLDYPLAFTDYPKAIPDSTWPCGGFISKKSIYTPEEGCVTWKIASLRNGNSVRDWHWVKSKLRSEDFSFAGARWNLFASFDEENGHSLFGLSVLEYRSLDAGLDCYCTITFERGDYCTMKGIVFKFKVESSAISQCTVEDFLPDVELSYFMDRGADIVCRFSAKKICSTGTADISNSSRRNTFKAHTETQLQDNPTASAALSDLRSQPSGSVTSSAVLPPLPVPLPLPAPPTVTSRVPSVNPFGLDMAPPLGGLFTVPPVNEDPTAFAPQSDSRSQPSSSVRSSAVPPPLPVPPTVTSRVPSVDLVKENCPNLLFPGLGFPPPQRWNAPGGYGARGYGGGGGYGGQGYGGYGGLGYGGQGYGNYGDYGYGNGGYGNYNYSGLSNYGQGGGNYSGGGAGGYGFSASGPESRNWTCLSSLERFINAKLQTSPGYTMNPLLNRHGRMPGIPGDLTSSAPQNHPIRNVCPDRNGGPGRRAELQRNINPTSSAPQSGSGIQPSGSVRSSAVLPPAYTARAPSLPSSTSAFGGPVGMPYGGLFSMLGVPKIDPIGGPRGRGELQRNIEDNEGLPMVSSKVLKDFKNLLQSGMGTDVTLQVQDQQFKAHRIIIAARSSVFAALIQHYEHNGNATGVLKVEECDPASFPVLLEFLYCGDTEQLSVENVFSLYTSASIYDVQDLKMRCLQFIKHNLSVETFCETLRISFEHPETNLLTVATEFFIKHFKQISSMPEWETFLSENPVKGNKLFMEASKIKFQ